MPLVNMVEILQKAKREKYAVGAFNIVDYLTIDAVVTAAEEVSAPVIVQTSASTVKKYGCSALAVMVRVRSETSAVPIAFHLDHCKEVDLINQCMDYGWTSVMIDASSFPFEQNVAMTREVVERAHPLGLSVEGELGDIGGVEDQINVDTDQARLADPDKVVEFVERTGVDVLAPAIGTAHGLYKGIPKLDYVRLEEISRRIVIPVAIHGGTGLSPEQFHKLIECGGAKINISTQLKISYIDALKNYIDAHPTEYDPLRLIKRTGEEVAKMIVSFIELFGSSGKA